jgi:hypothetical protein
VERRGRFSVEGTQLRLVVEQGEAARGGQPLPESLAIEGSAPTEAGCPYTRL